MEEIPSNPFPQGSKHYEEWETGFSDAEEYASATLKNTSSTDNTKTAKTNDTKLLHQRGTRL